MVFAYTYRIVYWELKLYMETIEIKTEYIKLNQLLKLAGVISMGSEVKDLIDRKKIFLTRNNATEKNIVSELRKKIYDGDIVTVNEKIAAKLQVRVVKLTVG